MTVFLPPVPSGPTLTGELVAAALAGVAFLTLLAVAEAWRRALRPDPEWTRKFVHMGSGLVAMFFPWLFRTHWTLLALGAVMIGMFTLSRRFNWFPSVTDIGRPSAGERWFPVGVYTLYVVARHQPLFYLIALSSLVVSDALAALLGARYGEHTYPVAGGRKSIEGSTIFMLVTFLGVHVPLLLFTNIGRGESLMIATQLALLATSFEAISERGNDNLVVPLATYYLLVKMTPAPWEGIAVQLAVQLALLAGCLWLAWHLRFLSFAGAIATHLMLYAAFSLGGPAWTLAPLLALAGLIAIDGVRHKSPTRPPGGHQVRGVFWVSIVSVALLFADNSFATLIDAREVLSIGHPFHAPFVGALAAPVAIVFGERMKPRQGGRAWPRWLFAAVLGFAGVVPASLWLQGSAHVRLDLATAALLVGMAVAGYALMRERRASRGVGPGDLHLLGASVALAAVLATLFQLAWLEAI
jgi:dolichol kinase